MHKSYKDPFHDWILSLQEIGLAINEHEVNDRFIPTEDYKELLENTLYLANGWRESNELLNQSLDSHREFLQKLTSYK